MEYKVGDRIRIKDDLKESRGYKVSCVSNMLEFKGKECIITKVIEQGYTDVVYYNIDIDVFEWSFTDDMFDLVFTKDDLKPFQVVEFRNGELAIVCEVNTGKVLGNINNEGTYVRLSDYLDNLKTNNEPMYDIMKVYSYSDWVRSVFTVAIEDRELLWERFEINPRIKELEDLIENKTKETEELQKELESLRG